MAAVKIHGVVNSVQSNVESSRVEQIVGISVVMPFVFDKDCVIVKHYLSLSWKPRIVTESMQKHSSKSIVELKRYVNCFDRNYVKGLKYHARYFEVNICQFD